MKKITGLKLIAWLVYLLGTGCAVGWGASGDSPVGYIFLVFGSILSVVVVVLCDFIYTQGKLDERDI